MAMCRKKLMDLIPDKEAAHDCFFAVPRGGKTIRGPSVRLSEAMAAAYKNLNMGARIIEVGSKQVVAQGICHDLENNITYTMESRRSITDRNGKRYSDDMVNQTCQAALAIAVRNAILKTVPRAMFRDEMEQIRKIGLGEERDLPESRTAMLAWFEGKGIEPGRVLQMFDRKGIEDIDLEDIDMLRSIANAIKAGEISAEEAFKGFGAKPTGAMQAVNEMLVERKKSKPAEMSKKEADIRERIPGACESYAKLYVAMNVSKKGADRVHEAVVAAADCNPEELADVKSLADIDETDEGRAAIVLEYLKEGS